MEALSSLKQLIHFGSQRLRYGPSTSFFIVRYCSTDSAATTAGRPADRNRRSSAFTSTSTFDREAIRSIRINKNIDIDQLTPPCSSDSPGSVIKMFLRI